MTAIVNLKTRETVSNGFLWLLIGQQMLPMLFSCSYLTEFEMTGKLASMNVLNKTKVENILEEDENIRT